MVRGIHDFRVPRLILTGVGCRERIGVEAKALGGKRALIVTDRGVKGLGYEEEIRGSLEAAGLGVEVFDGVSREPEMGFVEEGLRIYREAGCDLVVAVGGGSPIDTAKGIATLATNGGSMRDYEGIGKIPKPMAPLIAVPTTAGTGSEVTKFTIITDVERRRKMLIGSIHLIPSVAVVDPILTLSMPPSLTAGTAIDALTHAIEAYISVRAQPLTDPLALQAIHFISKNLRRAWSKGDDLEARTRVMLGATMAGMAFSNSSVALVHGMSRPLGAHFHLPHGLSNSILLPHVMEFTYPGSPERFRDIAEAMGEGVEGLELLEAARRAVEAVGRLCRDVKVPSLKDVGVDEGKLEEVAHKMAEDAVASGSPANNPRKASIEEIIEIYRRAL